MNNSADKIIVARRWMTEGWTDFARRHAEDEGGCGVTGFACSIPVGGKHIYRPSAQMHNRGNGKGGGIAAVGLQPECLGVSREILENDYALHIALLDPSVRPELEADFINPIFDVHHSEPLKHLDDFRDVEGLEVRPPDVHRYFVRVKRDVLQGFSERHGLDDLPERDVEDEFVYQNSFQLNLKYYAALGEKRAFVLSHGRNMLILKIVGYAEQIIKYYELDDFKAHVWIAHQRYPTRGRVWHPGGAHPFCGLNEALVHNGDFANYYAVTEYLAQRNIRPLFLTDTEVSILVFDLWSRVYKYPLEYIIEGLAPTVERDFDMLPPEKREIYRHIQANHIHGSPDGPWFFIIARNIAEDGAFQLLGITDTAMLRPQVFALEKGEVEIGLICSEKQAIDATLRSLAEEDNRFCPIADDYWNARGGSYTDGGAFIFTLKPNGRGYKLSCTDKFGRERDGKSSAAEEHRPKPQAVRLNATWSSATNPGEQNRDGEYELFTRLANAASEPGLAKLTSICDEIASEELNDEQRDLVIAGLTLLIDRTYPTGPNRRAVVLDEITCCLETVLGGVAPIAENAASKYALIDWHSRHALRPPAAHEEILVVNARDFPPEGDECDARLVVEAYSLGWKRFICYGYVGQRFLGCGLGPNSSGVIIDAYGSTGDYLGSGLDGAELRVHGNAQDQVAQILKDGRLVIYGDVGQTFMYGAKGGTVFVLGNAAGRPLINAVGKPRAVINGTCLDFLAESFMAGDPLKGGGFVVLNGLHIDDQGNIIDLETPYPGSNLFSLASGGAIYVRDPHRKLDSEQLNGGEYYELTEADWKLIKPYLEENERLFDIPVSRLLTVDGEIRSPAEVYRKVAPAGKLPESLEDDDAGAEEV